MEEELRAGKEKGHRLFQASGSHLGFLCCVVFCAASGFVKRGDVYESQPGSFPCSVLLHACGENDAGIIEQVVVRIIEHCEKLQVSSVAIPALCTGMLAF